MSILYPNTDIMRIYVVIIFLFNNFFVSFIHKFKIMWYELATTFNMIIELYILIIVINIYMKRRPSIIFVQITDKVSDLYIPGA